MKRSERGMPVQQLDGEDLFFHVPVVESIVECLSPLQFFSLYSTSAKFYNQCQKLGLTPRKKFEETLIHCLGYNFGGAHICLILALLSEPNVFLTGGALVTALHADYNHFEKQMIHDLDIVVLPVEEGNDYVYQVPEQFISIMKLDSNPERVAFQTFMPCVRNEGDAFFFARRAIVDKNEVDTARTEYAGCAVAILDFLPSNADVTLSIIMSSRKTISDHLRQYDLEFCQNAYSSSNGMHITYQEALRTRHARLDVMTYFHKYVQSWSTCRLLNLFDDKIGPRLKKYRERGFTVTVVNHRRDQTYILLKDGLRDWFHLEYVDMTGQSYRLAHGPVVVDTLHHLDKVWKRDIVQYLVKEFAITWERLWHGQIRTSSEIKRQRV